MIENFIFLSHKQVEQERSHVFLLSFPLATSSTDIQVYFQIHTHIVAKEDVVVVQLCPEKISLSICDTQHRISSAHLHSIQIEFINILYVLEDDGGKKFHNLISTDNIQKGISCQLPEIFFHMLWFFLCFLFTHSIRMFYSFGIVNWISSSMNALHKLPLTHSDFLA